MGNLFKILKIFFIIAVTFHIQLRYNYQEPAKQTVIDMEKAAVCIRNKIIPDRKSVRTYKEFCDPGMPFMQQSRDYEEEAFIEVLTNFRIQNALSNTKDFYLIQGANNIFRNRVLNIKGSINSFLENTKTFSILFRVRSFSQKLVNAVLQIRSRT